MSAHETERKLIDWLRREGFDAERDTEASDPHLHICSFEEGYRGNMSAAKKRTFLTFQGDLNLYRLAEAIASGEVS